MDDKFDGMKQRHPINYDTPPGVGRRMATSLRSGIAKEERREIDAMAEMRGDADYVDGEPEAELNEAAIEDALIMLGSRRRPRPTLKRYRRRIRRLRRKVKRLRQRLKGRSGR